MIDGYPEDLMAENDGLRSEVALLRDRLEETQQTLEAIRNCEVDSLVLNGPEGPRIFSLQGADHSYRVLVEAMNEGAVTLNDEGVILYCNSHFARLLDAPLERTMGRPIVELVPERSRDALRSLLARAADADVRAEVSLCHEAGTEIPVYLSISLMMVEGRRRYCVIATDMREQKQIEAQRAAAFKERETLLKEIHHRVKNNLQVISSLFYLQGERTEHQGLRELLDVSRCRIQSIALIHEMLYASDDLGHIDFQAYLRALMNMLIALNGVRGPQIAIEIEARDIILDIDRAIPCALITNELVSNALRYAFPAGLRGKIRIAAIDPAPGWVSLVVSDTGVGMPADYDVASAKTLGIQLVRNLTKQLRGSLVLEQAEGTRFEVRFPVPLP